MVFSLILRMIRSTISGMKKQDPKVVENRLRDTLKRRGYRLEKSRRRDPHALTFGRYWIIGERIPIDRGKGIEDLAVDKKELHPMSFCLLVTKGGDRDHDFTMTLDEIDAVCSAKTNAFAPISGELYEAAKTDCVLAWEFYMSERGETMPSRAAFRASMPVAPAPTPTARRGTIPSKAAFRASMPVAPTAKPTTERPHRK
jgi:hypothetical protein